MPHRAESISLLLAALPTLALLFAAPRDGHQVEARPTALATRLLDSSIPRQGNPWPRGQSGVIVAVRPA